MVDNYPCASIQALSGLLGTNVNEGKDNINNSATKNKEIYLFIESWNVEGYTAIYVSTHDRKGQFWRQRGWRSNPTWDGNMTPLFDDQTNTAPLRK